MENKFIAIWGAQPGAGKRTVSRALARELAETEKAVLLVIVGEDVGAGGLRHPDPQTWVPRFESLSGQMLRNYLAAPEMSYAELSLKIIPREPILPEMVRLLKRAFDWVLWVSPADMEAGSNQLLDAANMLLWVAQPSVESDQVLKSSMEQLAARHYPNAFSQVVLNQTTAGPLMDLATPALVQIPRENPFGLAFHDGIERLAQMLRNRPDLYPTLKNVDSNFRQPNERVVEDLKARIQPQLLEALSQAEQRTGAAESKALPAELAVKALETCMAKDATVAATREERGELFNRVLDDVLGLGPLEPLLKDPEVSEVMVNGPSTIFVEKRGKLHPTTAAFSSDAQLRTMIDRIVAPIGRRVDESMPLCDARLADGSRVNIVLPPLALDGASITIRKFMTRKLGLPELVDFGSLSKPMADTLRACVMLRKNIVVAGGTGSGKTTLLNALSSLIPDDERIVTIEDAAELRLQKPHVVRLESRPPNAEGEGSIPIRRLVMNALRMRPDRIVVGECRGGEALDMLQAMNTGHDGSLTTVHANSPRDALGRLETLVLMAGMDLPIRVVREQIRSAVHIIVQQSRLSNGSRKITSITEVTGMEGDTLTTQELYRYHSGRFETTGIVPSFARDLAALAC